MRCGVQVVLGMKKLALVLASVGASFLPDWGSKDDDYCLPETLRDKAQSRSLVAHLLYGLSIELIPLKYTLETTTKSRKVFGEKTKND